VYPYTVCRDDELRNYGLRVAAVTSVDFDATTYVAIIETKAKLPKTATSTIVWSPFHIGPPSHTSNSVPSGAKEKNSFIINVYQSLEDGGIHGGKRVIERLVYEM